MGTEIRTVSALAKSKPSNIGTQPFGVCVGGTGGISAVVPMPNAPFQAGLVQYICCHGCSGIISEHSSCSSEPGARGSHFSRICLLKYFWKVVNKMSRSWKLSREIAHSFDFWSLVLNVCSHKGVHSNCTAHSLVVPPHSEAKDHVSFVANTK